MKRRKIYLASSWRNPLQPQALKMLRDAGHEVYDFRNPTSDNQGFSWSAIDPHWQAWTPKHFILALEDSKAKAGFSLDKSALDWCAPVSSCSPAENLPTWKPGTQSDRASPR